MRAMLSIVAVAACHTATPAPPAAGTSFGFYLLAMTWMPNLCCGQACTKVAPSLTLHGLWPNYTDEQSRGRTRAWPQFCGAYAHCEHAEDPSCAPGAPVPADLAAIAPGYVDGTLRTHEWSKHGSCTKLGAADYFAAELAAIRSIPHVDALAASAGHDPARGDLQRAFGVAPEAVVLGCDDHCRLTQVGFCIAKDIHDRPAGAMACSANVTTSDYDNGCVTRHCDKVAIQAAGSCH